MGEFKPEPNAVVVGKRKPKVEGAKKAPTAGVDNTEHGEQSEQQPKKAKPGAPMPAPTNVGKSRGGVKLFVNKALERFGQVGGNEFRNVCI